MFVTEIRRKSLPFELGKASSIIFFTTEDLETSVDSGNRVWNTNICALEAVMKMIQVNCFGYVEVR